MIKFKPTHEAFRKLQEAYVEAQMHLSQAIEEGGKRLKQIEEDLRQEQAQFEQMCSQFMNKDAQIMDAVADHAVATGLTPGQASAGRKNEIIKMFTEVQQTQ